MSFLTNLPRANAQEVLASPVHFRVALPEGTVGPDMEIALLTTLTIQKISEWYEDATGEPLNVILVGGDERSFLIALAPSEHQPAALLDTFQDLAHQLIDKHLHPHLLEHTDWGNAGKRFIGVMGRR